MSSLTAGKSKRTGTLLPADDGWGSGSGSNDTDRGTQEGKKLPQTSIIEEASTNQTPVNHDTPESGRRKGRRSNNDEEVNELLNGTNGAFPTDAQNSPSNPNLEGVFERPAVVLVCFITQEKNSEHKQKTSYLHSHMTEKLIYQ